MRAVVRYPTKWLLFFTVLLAGTISESSPLHGQETADSLSQEGAVADSLGLPAPSGLPVFAVLGVAFGTRNDPCVLCESPQDNKSFTGHLSVGRPLAHGIGLGLDVSVWRKGRPGTPGAPDAEGIPEPTSLTNMLGNASVSLSYRIWHVYVRGGVGLAFGRQDLEFVGPTGDLAIHTASGFGIGYSAGAGFTVPVASLISMAVFANWNMGAYDLVSPQGLTERGASHQWLEVGVGVAVK